MNRYVGNLPPMPGVFPDYPAPVICNAGGERELTMMRWGMPPPPKFGGPPAGALGEIRTPDPRIRSPMLYPAELRARAWVRLPDLAKQGYLKKTPSARISDPYCARTVLFPIKVAQDLMQRGDRIWSPLCLTSFFPSMFLSMRKI
jgi:hypothetical protein